jgi:hypothetical protein
MTEFDAEARQRRERVDEVVGQALGIPSSMSAVSTLAPV